MIVLHGSWLDDQWFLWGEDVSGKPEAAVFDNEPPLWGCSREALTASASATTAAALAPADARLLTAWLPAAKARPLSSQPWQRRATPTAATLQPFGVWALPLPSAALFELLAAAANDRRLARGVMAGHTVTAWADLQRYAGAIIARHQFLPEIHRAAEQTSAEPTPAPASEVLKVADTSYEARWSSALDKLEQRRFNALAASLPPAAVCLTASAAAAPPDEPPADRAGSYGLRVTPNTGL